MNSQRREAIVAKIAHDFMIEHAFHDRRIEHALIGAVRIGMFEATRACLYETTLSPSTRMKIEAGLGFEGITREAPRV
jgi:hypothetical protein